MFFDYDNEINLKNIKSDYANIYALKEILSEKRSEFRNFAKDLDLNEKILIDCIDKYEYGLLISCYTFSEQITKNFFYELLEKDQNTNKYVNAFINFKVPVNKFSPNVKIEGINTLLKEINGNFGFIITDKDNNFFKIYNEMIKSRHKYAHAGGYSFSFEQFQEVISVLDYLNFEFKMHINNEKKREAIKNSYHEIKNIIRKDLKSGKNFELKNPNMKEHLKKTKKLTQKFLLKYESILINLEIFSEILIVFKIISSIDLRKSNNNLQIANSIKKLSQII